MMELFVRSSLESSPAGPQLRSVAGFKINSTQVAGSLKGVGV